MSKITDMYDGIGKVVFQKVNGVLQPVTVHGACMMDACGSKEWWMVVRRRDKGVIRGDRYTVET